MKMKKKKKEKRRKQREKREYQKTLILLWYHKLFVLFSPMEITFKTQSMRRRCLAVFRTGQWLGILPEMV